MLIRVLTSLCVWVGKQQGENGEWGKVDERWNVEKSLEVILVINNLSEDNLFSTRYVLHTI